MLPNTRILEMIKNILKANFTLKKLHFDLNLWMNEQIHKIMHNRLIKKSSLKKNYFTKH